MQPSLVQRLRDSVTQCRALDRSQLLTEAADEIARMNGEVVLWRAVASLNVPEREALRQALGLLQQRLRRRYTARLDVIDMASDLNSVEVFGPKRD